MKNTIIALSVVLAMGAAQAAIINITQVEAFGDLSGNTYDLTTMGTQDWTVYGGGTLAPSDEMNGGAGIGALAYTPPNQTTYPGAALTVKATATGKNPLLSWSNGTTLGSASGKDVNPLMHDSDPATKNGGQGSIGQSFTLTVDAATSPSTLYLWLLAENSVFSINANLSGANQTMTGQGTGNNAPIAALYQIDFTADVASDQLTIDLLKTSVQGGSNSRFGVQSAALVPEPVAMGLITFSGLALLAARRIFS